MTIKAKDIKPGTRIGFHYGAGCGEAMGTAYGRTPSRFYGFTCRVKLDDHTFTEIVDADTIPNTAHMDPERALSYARGIGAYILPGKR